VNPLTCWIDSQALEYVLDTSEASATAPLSLREKAVSMYKGPFLSANMDLSYAVLRREKLKSRLLGVIGAIGGHYEKTEEWERASDYYIKGIEIDGMAEELYRRLMICYRNLGNNAAVAKTYNRCRNLLQAEWGIAPSPETTAVYNAIAQKQ
jgi:two-component SAPR family response regulator